MTHIKFSPEWLMERYQQVTQERDALRADRDAIVEEAHRRLDEAGVPSALGATCDDPACQTQIGHRIKVLRQERDALRQRVDLLRDTLGLTSSLLRVVMDATYQSDDGWNPHPDVDNRTWSPDAHVGLTFTVQELRQMKGALARARTLLSGEAPTE